MWPGKSVLILRFAAGNCFHDVSYSCFMGLCVWHMSYVAIIRGSLLQPPAVHGNCRLQQGTRCWRIGLDTTQAWDGLGWLSGCWILVVWRCQPSADNQKLQDLPADDVCCGCFASSVQQVQWCREGAEQHCFILPWQLAHHSGLYWLGIWNVNIYGAGGLCFRARIAQSAIRNLKHD